MFSCLHFTLVETEIPRLAPGPEVGGPVPGWGTLPASMWGGGLGRERGAGEAPVVESRPGPGAEPGEGKRAGITCCGECRSAATGCARAPGPAVPEVAVGPPARTPGRPRPIGAVDGPEETSGT